MKESTLTWCAAFVACVITALSVADMIVGRILETTRSEYRTCIVKPGPEADCGFLLWRNIRLTKETLRGDVGSFSEKSVLLCEWMTYTSWSTHISFQYYPGRTPLCWVVGTRN